MVQYNQRATTVSRTRLHNLILVFPFPMFISILTTCFLQTMLVPFLIHDNAPESADLTTLLKKDTLQSKNRWRRSIWRKPFDAECNDKKD